LIKKEGENERRESYPNRVKIASISAQQANKKPQAVRLGVFVMQEKVLT
jgi:hypothetical protein